ncbi:MAG: extracellular solute-binding protein, partial [Chloroflexota bacterium]|nr:extracellular solute-binding protein [Chloroflexota bacterium]
MRARQLTIGIVAALVFTGCAGGGGGGGGAGGGGGGGGAQFDPNAVSGTVSLGGWKATPEEAKALEATLQAFQAKFPKIKVEYQPIGGDQYTTVMLTKLTSKQPPDLFYVNAEYAPDWIEQGVLQPLDDWIKGRNFDTSQFYEGYLQPFKGTDGKLYGLPKDGNTIAMAYNPDLLQKAGVSAPTTLDELVSVAQKLKGTGVKFPMCLNAALDRGLAFIYAQGGALLAPDGKAPAIDSAESKAAVQWYLDLFKNGLGETAKNLGDDWCGKSLGEKKVAIVFEGGWLDPFMQQTYKGTKYSWAEMPAGKTKATLGYTVSYSIGTDSKNKDAAWVLLTYLTGPEGMAKWTEGGVADPSRKDVKPAAGKEILVKGGGYAKPGSGFMLGYNDVQKAFKDAMDAELTSKTYS